MLPCQVISLLKKLSKSAAKCFRVSAQSPLNILAVLDFQMPALKQRVALLCMASMGRRLGELETGHWGVRLQTCQLVSGRRDPEVFSEVTGELLQESVQPRSRTVVQGTRLVLPVLKLVICSVESASLQA